jgi:hypothetical protein
MKTFFLRRSFNLKSCGSVFLALLLSVAGCIISIRAQESSAKLDARAEGGPVAEQKAAKSSSAQDQSKIKVVFDENSPGVVYVESNGEKIRVDTTKKTVEQIAVNDKNIDQPTSGPATAKNERKPDKDESAYDFDRGEEPYDYRIVNIPTPKSIPKGSWNLVFTHRFTQPVHPLSDSAKNLFGLDSFGVASFGLMYGVTDKFYLSAYRSPLCQRGLCRTIEVGAGYNWLEMDKDSPVALTTYASIEGNDNFTEEYTYNLQARLAARIGKRVYLFFSPAVHINSNGQRRFDPRPTDFFPPATVAEDFRLPTHGASFGFGTSIMLTPNVVALFDFTPRTGFKLGQVRPIFDNNFHVIGFTNESHPAIGFGIQRNIGKHAFALTLSNTQTTTTSRYNSSNLVLSPKYVVIGFNLSRRF